ncbi:MAG: heavy-metal-associated domain-containing protein [Candidatus Blackburnbacteria bacterium]|nr:heavy-metal-associated domain-containing protein [Candidatus Blackburnbacteria bacterium]
MTTIVKKRFKVDGLNCTACAILIDGELENTEGVKCASTNYAKAECEVEFDETKVEEKDIKKIIESLGYTVNLDDNR